MAKTDTQNSIQFFGRKKRNEESSKKPSASGKVMLISLLSKNIYY
jgi:hypothetical protein